MAAVSFPLVAAVAAAAVHGNGALSRDPANLASGNLTFGAIRWDCWYNTSWAWPDPGFAIQRALSLPQFRSAVPWFCELDGPGGDGNITCNNNVAAVVDAEISQAVAAGIDYWAFDSYPEDVALSVPKQLYWNSTSPAKAALRWCLVLQTGWIASGGLAGWPAQVAQLVAGFARDDHMTVIGGRPLVYLFAAYEDAWGPGTGWSAWQQALGLLANATAAAGIPQPYIAAMVWSAGEGEALLVGINGGNNAGGARLISALSSYAFTEGAAYPVGGAYAVMADASPGYWASLAGAGADVVPPVGAGWDPRPMNESALPWQNYTNPAFLVMPEPAQLAGFV
jgi:hypothetical protein